MSDDPERLRRLAMTCYRTAVALRDDTLAALLFDYARQLQERAARLERAEFATSAAEDAAA